MIIFLLLMIILIYLCLCIALPPAAGKKRYRNSQAVQPLNSDTYGAGERIRCLDDNKDALIWWLRVIAEAKDTVIMANHDLRPDNSGKDLMCALLAAADRGVRVQILVDGIRYRMLKWNPWVRAVAYHPGVEIRIYNQMSFFCFWRSNYRMHDKYIIADDRLYLLGGRNANDLFLGDYSLQHNIDRDILVYETTPEKETSLKELKQYFDTIWELPCSNAFNPKCFKKVSRKKTEELAIRYRTLKSRFDISPGIDWKKETWEAQRISLLTNLPHNGNKEPVLWNTLCRQMEKGKSIRIQTPYLICSRNMYQDLRGLVCQGSELQVITNSASSGANYFGCSDYLNNKKKILKTGITVYEYYGTHSLHSKAVIIDDAICMVGSFNMDMRSAYLDTELMLLIESPYLSEHLKNETEKIMNGCVKVQQHDRSKHNKEKWTLRRQGLFLFLRLVDKPFHYLL